MKTTLTAMIAAATLLTGVAATPAAAHSRGYSHGHDDDRYDERYDDRGYDYNRGGYDRGYDWQDYRYRGDRRCDRGTGGTIIGAIAGGLAGRELAGRRGDRTAGAIIGAGVGALAGRAIDRSNSRCR